MTSASPARRSAWRPASGVAFGMGIPASPTRMRTASMKSTFSVSRTKGDGVALRVAAEAVVVALAVVDVEGGRSFPDGTGRAPRDHPWPGSTCGCPTSPCGPRTCPRLSLVRSSSRNPGGRDMSPYRPAPGPCPRGPWVIHRSAHKIFARGGGQSGQNEGDRRPNTITASDRFNGTPTRRKSVNL